MSLLQFKYKFSRVEPPSLPIEVALPTSARDTFYEPFMVTLQTTESK